MKKIILGSVLVIVIGCAAQGPVNVARVGALTAGELALEVDKQEREIYAANVPGYDKVDHDRVGNAILKLLYAVRGYERAIVAIPQDQPLSTAVITARNNINAAIADLQKVLPQIAVVRDPINRALAALAAWLNSPQARAHVEGVQYAQLPPNVMMFFALINLITSMVASGRTSYAKIKVLLQKEGATDAELLELDNRLSDAINAREKDRGVM